MISPGEGLRHLQEGNRRFLSGSGRADSLVSEARRKELVLEHNPFAIILGCSDARVPAEIIFDQGLGDLFVIRVAGNIVAPSQIGSVEFAAERFGTKLVVVLGHTGCGAILATLEELRRPTESHSMNLRSIVDRVRPSVEALFQGSIPKDEEALERAMATQPQWAAHDRPQPEMLWDFIGDIGLDMVKAKADAKGPAIEQLLRQDVADMQALKVDRTPGFFVNGTPLREFGEAQLKALVEQEIKKAGAP